MGKPKVSVEYKTTTNRTVYNRARKEMLERRALIRCSYCQYHDNENCTVKGYGEGRFPNWKLVSKSRKQWMKKPIKIVTTIHHRWDYTFTYTEITF